MLFEGNRRVPAVIRLSEEQRADLSTLAQVQVPTPDGAFVPPASVADIRGVDGLNQISHENGKRRVVVQVNVRGRDIVSVVEDAHAEITKDIRLPGGQPYRLGRPV